MHGRVDATREAEHIPFVRTLLVPTSFTALLGALVAYVVITSPSLLDETRGASAVPARVEVAAAPPAALPAALPIVPAPAIDPGAARFIGTGDGSNGAWSRP
jgi:hypothetical protein